MTSLAIPLVGGNVKQHGIWFVLESLHIFFATRITAEAFIRIKIFFEKLSFDELLVDLEATRPSDEKQHYITALIYVAIKEWRLLCIDSAAHATHEYCHGKVRFFSSSPSTWGMKP